MWQWLDSPQGFLSEPVAAVAVAELVDGESAAVLVQFVVEAAAVGIRAAAGSRVLAGLLTEAVQGMGLYTA